MRLLLALPLLLLPACDAGHLGNPLLLPITGLATAVENTSFNAHRARVSDLLAANQPAVMAEALSTPGPALAALYQTAQIPPASQPAILRDLAEISAAPPADWVERATTIAMVHSI
ncbi:hypothetical protein [Hasllibacter sp. MH4015]|uniref:hypothetical protein n=1 Tax=Hasllibacter sp. MH4015 TaxID=2854029 RepID=UPI001CD633CD|nr:hypothetical protein [Hasllibacter sp. MH4015]